MNAPDSANAAENPLQAGDATRRNAIWIASYPQSGNTWVGVFLYNLFRELGGVAGAQDIDRLHQRTAREVLKPAFARRLEKPVEAATKAEIAAVRAQVQADVAHGRAKPALIKTHNAVANVEGGPTINIDVTQAAVYIVRNPLDVAVSYAHHWGSSLFARPRRRSTASSSCT